MIKSFTRWINESEGLKPTMSVSLRELILDEIEKLGVKADLNHIDVSQVTDMSYLFQGLKFNGDISKWDVSNVTNMFSMFTESKFSGDISGWDVSKVTNMEKMFFVSTFSGDISNWNVNQDTYTHNMFLYSNFEGDITKWKIPLEKKADLYLEMKPFKRFDYEFIEKLISIAIENKVPLSGETLNSPPFVTRVTSNKLGI